MPKKDYGNIVFYRTKDGKLRWFDPDKAKTPEGKAKIKAIRSGKSKNAKIGTNKDKVQTKLEQIAKEEVKRTKEYEITAKNYRDAVENKKDVGKAAKAVHKASNAWRNIVNEENRTSLEKLGDPKERTTRDEKNIERARKKAAERAHQKEIGEAATNPNFDAKKFAKYFKKENGKVVLDESKSKEYFDKYHGQNLNIKSAEAQKEAKEKAKKAEKPTSKSKLNYYTDKGKNDDEFRKNALHEMKRYENNWSGMTAREKKNISPGGIKELRARIKELEAAEKVKSAKPKVKITEMTEERKKKAKKAYDKKYHYWAINPIGNRPALDKSGSDKWNDDERWERNVNRARKKAQKRKVWKD